MCADGNTGEKWQSEDQSPDSWESGLMGAREQSQETFNPWN